MILSAHQPAYLPWLGYFDKVLRSDVFVFLDDVQFEKNSYINRNRIRTAQGSIWLSVPVRTKGHLSGTLRDTQIDRSQNWKAKHLKSIWLNYRAAPMFETLYPKLEQLYREEDLLLADLCFRQLRFWLAELAIDTPIVRSSSLPVHSRKSDLVFDLCRQFGATRYISGALGRDYLEPGKFQAAGIEVEFQEYAHPVYTQRYKPFLPNMGILDYCMNNADSKKKAI